MSSSLLAFNSFLSEPNSTFTETSCILRLTKQVAADTFSNANPASSFDLISVNSNMLCSSSQCCKLLVLLSESIIDFRDLSSIIKLGLLWIVPIQNTIQ